jgi:uncharacterized protein DUF6065/cupin-like protein
MTEQRKPAPVEADHPRSAAMDLICYLHPGWEPLIRPAAATRAWMDATPEAFAYRCLPLNIANAHGWEILTPFGFEAMWSGGTSTADVSVRLPAGARNDLAPVSLFGQGVLTLHIFGLFRTPPGWNLWVGGSPNSPKDGIYPLSGIVETDWSPYTFTMNWRFTRPNHWVRFEEKEPICFIYPVQRGYLDEVRPKFVPMEKDPELMRQFKAWSASRDQFQAKVAKEQPQAGSEKWQKRYYRGVDMDEKPGVPDHQIKPRPAAFAPGEAEPHAAAAPAAPQPQRREVVVLAPFAAAEAKAGAAAGDVRAAPPAAGPGSAAAGSTAEPSAIQRALQSIGTELMFGAAPAPLVQRLIALGAPEAEAKRIIETASNDALIVNGRAIAQTLRKRDWLLETMEKHWQLRPGSDRIERRAELSSEEFLERYYAPGRPVVLVGEMADWPALAKWTPQYLKEKIGGATIEYQGERKKNERFEMYKDEHRREMPFDRFIDLITRPETGNDAYMTAYNSAKNADAVARLHGDLGFLDKVLDRAVAQPHGMMWIGPAGTVTSLHHDLTDNLIAQVVGRKRLKVVAAADVAKIYNHHHVFSEIADLEDPASGPARFPALKDVRIYDVALSPGEALFMPIGWWHQVKSLDFSVTITYTNFRWPNEMYRTYPSG